MPITNPSTGGGVETATQIARKLETLTGADKFDAKYLKNNTSTLPIATTAIVGGVMVSDGLQADVNGALSVKVASGVKLDASKNIIIDAINIDVTTLNKADTLVSSIYQDALNITSTLVTLTNATKGSWWNVAAAVTISGTAFGVGDQLWCRTTTTGIPTDLVNFVRVPASVAIATTTTFGTVKFSNLTPLKSAYTPLVGTSQFVSREDHVHPREEFNILPHNQANSYLANEITSKNNLYWKANANIPSSTVFAEGVTGATWKLFTFPVRHDITLAVGRFGIDNTGIYFEDGLTL
jgi:hypothetical protein